MAKTKMPMKPMKGMPMAESTTPQPPEGWESGKLKGMEKKAGFPAFTPKPKKGK